jgi:hypothetical protein
MISIKFHVQVSLVIVEMSRVIKMTDHFLDELHFKVNKVERLSDILSFMFG